DITPFTALDYPDHLAAIFWFAKCQMQCVYCYNRDIVFGNGKISQGEALTFLQNRKGLLEGVVLSGGEATLYESLAEFCKQIKQLNFKIKLDTNGLNPQMIYTLVENNLVDYIALDYKAPKQKFQSITKNKHFDAFSATLDYLIKKEFPFEVRTTVHSDLLQVEDINQIIKDLLRRDYRDTYYLQKFIYTPDTIGKVKDQKNTFDLSRLSSDIKVIWRG
ncbi:MAG: Anaerobic ribonucleoside-triphosphate reductase activating protein, partial [Campylobacterota bacterium]|nr:Anaerobic ribonucleoside-triphosphate reductase activating protein [Campylobacterota bacterium]